MTHSEENHRFHEPILAPSDFARLTGLSPEMQRLKRNRQEAIMQGVGTRSESGRWRYSYFNALTMRVIFEMEAVGWPTIPAVASFSETSSSFWQALRNKVLNEAHPVPELIMFRRTLSDPSDEQKDNCEFSTKLSEVRSYVGGHFINYEALVNQLPNELLIEAKAYLLSQSGD